jgi:uncharacterized protein YegJ (DUF2314 family)
MIACGQSVVDRAEKDDLYLAADGDKDMEEAFRQARNGLDGFLKLSQDPSSDKSNFSVKVGITENGNTEYFWISPFQVNSGSFTGILNNEPRMVTSVSLGQEIAFKKEQIVDWLYSDQGRMVGNFTACAILKKASESEQRAFEQRFGLRCAP